MLEEAGTGFESVRAERTLIGADGLAMRFCNDETVVTGDACGRVVVLATASGEVLRDVRV